MLLKTIFTIIFSSFFYFDTNTNLKKNIDFVVVLETVEVTATDLQLERLTRCVMSEAHHDELWVAQTIMNRYNNWKYKTITDVITDKNQFSGYNTYRFNNCLSKSLYNSLKPIYTGDTVVHNYHYFINFDIATDSRQIKIAKKSKGETFHKHFYYNIK